MLQNPKGGLKDIRQVPISSDLKLYFTWRNQSKPMRISGNSLYFDIRSQRLNVTEQFQGEVKYTRIHFPTQCFFFALLLYGISQGVLSRYSRWWHWNRLTISEKIFFKLHSWRLGHFFVSRSEDPLPDKNPRKRIHVLYVLGTHCSWEIPKMDIFKQNYLNLYSAHRLKICRLLILIFSLHFNLINFFVNLFIVWDMLKIGALFC